MDDNIARVTGLGVGLWLAAPASARMRVNGEVRELLGSTSLAV